MSPEGLLLKQCRQILDGLKAFGLLAYRRIHASRDTTDMTGMPDLEIYLPRGKILHVELKSKNDYQSKKQLEWQKDLEALGHTYKIVTNPRELERLLTKKGIEYVA